MHNMPGSSGSERPILASGSSKRTSTYSKSPSSSSSSSSSRHSEASMPSGNQGVDISDYTTSLYRLDDKRLLDQRYVVSPQKEGDMSKLALAGKVERALSRRYDNQDAVMKPRKVSEKV